MVSIVHAVISIRENDNRICALMFLVTLFLWDYRFRIFVTFRRRIGRVASCLRLTLDDAGEKNKRK